MTLANAQEEHAAQFKKDRLFNLITRLRHNVIKSGLRKICVSYSHIKYGLRNWMCAF